MVTVQHRAVITKSTLASCLSQFHKSNQPPDFPATKTPSTQPARSSRHANFSSPLLVAFKHSGDWHTWPDQPAAVWFVAGVPLKASPYHPGSHWAKYASPQSLCFLIICCMCTMAFNMSSRLVTPLCFMDCVQDIGTPGFKDQLLQGRCAAGCLAAPQLPRYAST